LGREARKKHYRKAKFSTVLDSDFGSEANDGTDLENNNIVDLMNIDEDSGQTNGDTDDGRSGTGSDWSNSDEDFVGTAAGHYMDSGGGSDVGSDYSHSNMRFNGPMTDEDEDAMDNQISLDEMQQELEEELGPDDEKVLFSASTYSCIIYTCSLTFRFDA
jgi:hypothetical protein